MRASWTWTNSFFFSLSLAQKYNATYALYMFTQRNVNFWFLCVGFPFYKNYTQFQWKIKCSHISLSVTNSPFQFDCTIHSDMHDLSNNTICCMVKCSTFEQMIEHKTQFQCGWLSQKGERWVEFPQITSIEWKCEQSQRWRIKC